MRGGALGVALFVLTAGAHTAVDGQAAHLIGVLWLLPAMIGLSAVLADRRRSIAWLAAYLLGAEALCHVVLSLSLGHDGHAVSMAPTSGMVLGHIGAACIAAVLLHHSDTLLDRWLRFLTALTRGAPTVTAAGPYGLGLPRQFHVVFTPRFREHDWLARRGPPVVTA